MKRILIIGLLIGSFLTACRHDNDPAPGQRPDERLNQTLSDYRAILLKAPYGWKAKLDTKEGGGYSFLFNFSENDRVSMLADINSSTADEIFESTYRLKAAQRPSLLFDTYSYLHLLSDPDPNVAGGDNGLGKLSDFEFTFESATDETITLVGHFNQSKLVLTKATQDEAANFIRRVSESAAVFENINDFTTYFKRLNLGPSTVDVSVDTNWRTITFSYFEGSEVKTFTTHYSFTETGILLEETFSNAGITISALNSIQHNSASKRLFFTSNDVAGSIQEASAPIQIDQQATDRFFALPEEDYLVTDGFTVEGVPDAIGMRSIPNYYFMLFWPKQRASGGRVYDLLGVVTRDPSDSSLSLDLGTAATSRKTADGRIIYTLLGTIGEVSGEIEAKLAATTQLYTDTRGFYVVPTGPRSYDLVSAKDAKAWISLYQ